MNDEIRVQDINLTYQDGKYVLIFESKTSLTKPEIKSLLEYIAKELI